MRFSYVFLCGFYTYFCAVLQYSCPPYAPHLGIYDVAGFSLRQFLLRGVGVCAQAIKPIWTSDRIKLRGSHTIQQEIRHLLQNKFALG